jgi:hypothetical protein
MQTTFVMADPDQICCTHRGDAPRALKLLQGGVSRIILCYDPFSRLQLINLDRLPPSHPTVQCPRQGQSQDPFPPYDARLDLNPYTFPTQYAGQRFEERTTYRAFYAGT